MTFDRHPGLARARFILTVLLLALSVSAGIATENDAFARGRKKRAPAKTIEPDMFEGRGLGAGEILAKNMDRYFALRRPLYGSFVAIDPSSGKLISVSQFRLADRVKNPAVTAAFPAASIFKIISAAALLEAGVPADEQVCYTGGRRDITLGNLVDRKSERSCRTMDAAFAHSTNAVFAKLADKHLKADMLMDMARRFGFGRTINIGSLSTTSGIERPQGRLGLARMAAGFSGSNLSAMHGAVIAAVIANGGKWPSSVTLSGSKERESIQVVSPEIAKTIGRMMVQTVSGGTGTKHLASIRALTGDSPAIKTGTLTSRDGSGTWNNWVVGYYPAHKPEIAFAAHIGNTWAGGPKAAQAVRFAIKTWVAARKARQ